MVYLYVVMLIFVLLTLRPQNPNQVFDRADTKTLQGFFALAIMLHHIILWVEPVGEAAKFNNAVGCIGVGGFFMLSAYGLMKSSIEKHYEKRLFLNRIPTLYFEFVFVNIIYFFTVHLGQRPITVGSFFVKLFGLELFFKMDNMNMYAWFVVTILIIYVIFGLILLLSRLYKRNKYVTATLFSLAIIGLYFFVIKLGLNALYVRSLFCFPIGIWYATLEKPIKKYLRSWFSFALLTAILVAAFYVVYKKEYAIGSAQIGYTHILAIITCLMVIVLNQKFTIKSSKFWQFFGKYSLDIYLVEFVALRTVAAIRFVNPWLLPLLGIPFNIILALLLSIMLEAIFKKVEKVKQSRLRQEVLKNKNSF